MQAYTGIGDVASTTVAAERNGVMLITYFQEMYKKKANFFIF